MSGGFVQSRTHTIVRFFNKVDTSGPVPDYAPHLGPCWLWTGALTHGYGTFAAVTLSSARAHRFAYELLVGPIPDETPHLDHLCRVRACVNPTHLEPVTPAENNRRTIGILDGRGAIGRSMTHCIHGHEFTPENTMFRSKQGGRGFTRNCRICTRAQNAARMQRVRQRQKDAS